VDVPVIQEGTMSLAVNSRAHLLSALALGAVLAAGACKQASAPSAEGSGAGAWYSRIVTGTWGGEDAGLIANDSTAHVHIGCTLGDTNGPIVTDETGHFETPGTYDVDAYPVARGILHPARFIGQVTGQTIVLTVVLTDTARTLGPVTLTYGKEPQMHACPICRVPKARHH
jgi:hypothetical protein